MNIVLWVLQGLLAALFVVAGSTKVFLFEKISQQVASHYSYGEYSPVTFSLVLAAVAAFVAYGRFVR